MKPSIEKDQKETELEEQEILDASQVAYVSCPFCEENDFDTIGLKYHLLKYCEDFKKLNVTK